MTIDIPGVRAGRHAGVPALLVETAEATAAVSPFGAHLLSWTPRGFADVLWLSPTSMLPPKPIRGGVPVCWPYFARQGQPDDAPQHGIARTRTWSLVGGARDEAGAVRLDFVLDDADPDLEVRMEVEIGRALVQRLVTRNRGTAARTLTQAMHTYFAVGDARRVHVEGLDGLDYLDKFDGFARHRQQGDWSLREARDPGRSDRIYLDAPGRYVLVDPVARRRILLSTAGSRSLVAWNPGEEAVRGFADIPREGWLEYVCLEAANAAPDSVELAPGASHALEQRVEVAHL
ncbi:D-hexose-6-phosphate mutarotase [Coralloluteibacterium thermophilus]|uniref:Putative glucose-6-phosphate 1-epimerase n=1 Tax=Coralloluteibacterium thermophilum TaxID=2707049 RepID=A0ABV9NKS0_9GAMM